MTTLESWGEKEYKLERNNPIMRKIELLVIIKRQKIQSGESKKIQRNHTLKKTFEKEEVDECDEAEEKDAAMVYWSIVHNI